MINAAALTASVARALAGRPSLQLVIVASLALLWLVGALTLYIAAFRVYHYGRLRWRAWRRPVFEAGVEKALVEDPVEDVVAALRPRLPGDADIAQEAVIEAMRHLLGGPFELLREASRRLGFVERNLRRARSRRRYVRGGAMEALGVMRVREARDTLARAALDDSADMRLVALRSLALIREPADLDHFVEAAASLPPATLVRLASLMMEFGPVARPYVAKLISRHPSAFTPRVMKLMLAEAAAAEEAS